MKPKVSELSTFPPDQTSSQHNTPNKQSLYTVSALGCVSADLLLSLTGWVGGCGPATGRRAKVSEVAHHNIKKPLNYFINPIYSPTLLTLHQPYLQPHPSLLTAPQEGGRDRVLEYPPELLENQLTVISFPQLVKRAVYKKEGGAGFGILGHAQSIPPS